MSVTVQKLAVFLFMSKTKGGSCAKTESCSAPTMATCMECRSASLYTATERTPIFLAVRITRHAISPRLAISTFSILPTAGQHRGNLSDAECKALTFLRGRDDSDYWNQHQVHNKIQLCHVDFISCMQKAKESIAFCVFNISKNSISL